MVFTKGKYKGYTVQQIKNFNPGYIKWCEQNAPYILPSSKSKEEDEKNLDPIIDVHTLRILNEIVDGREGKNPQQIWAESFGVRSTEETTQETPTQMGEQSVPLVEERGESQEPSNPFFNFD